MSETGTFLVSRAISKPHEGGFLKPIQSTVNRVRANMAHVRQSRPGPGLGFQVKVLNTLAGVPSSLGSEGLKVSKNIVDRVRGSRVSVTV